MKTSFINSRQSLFLLFIFTLIAAAFIIFYIKHVDDKKEQLIQRNFRQLNAVSLSIQSRVDGLSTAITNIVNDKDNDSSDISEKLTSLISNLDGFNISKKNTKYSNSIWFKERNDSLLLILNKKYSQYYITIRVKGIDDIIIKKKKQDLFDDLFLATDTGYVIPSSQTISISKIKKVVELNKKDSVDFSDISSSDAIAKYTLGGEEYMLFIHPTRMYASPDSNIKRQWTICGLIRSDKFQTESQAVSANVILVFIVLIILIGLSWPLLKLRFASRYEHIKTSDIIIASLSLLFIAAVLTFTVMDIFVSVYKDNNVDKNLSSIAADMEKNFQSEIENVNNELDSLSKNYNSILKINKHLLIESIKNFNLNKQPYPYFDMAAWINYESGMQEYKLLMKRKKTSFVPVKNREYYKNVINNNLWNVGNAKNIFIQPIITWTTGDFITTLSKKVKLKDKYYVGAIDFMPSSLYSPVLPLGYSFCVIDNDGQVIYHSNSDRNLIENFFTECSSCSNIKAAIKSKTQEYFNTDYWGKEIRGMVYPIKGTPWNIIMMHDKRNLSGNNVLIISLSSSLFIIYLIPFFLFVIVFMVLKWIHKSSMWPQIDKADIYLRLRSIFIIFSIIMVIYYIWGRDLNNIFVVTWLYPHSATVLGFLILITRFRKKEINDSKNLWLLFWLVLIIDAVIIFLLLRENNFPPVNLWRIFIVWIPATIFGAYLLFDKTIIEKKALTPEKIWKSEKNIQKATRFYIWAFMWFLVLGAILPVVGYFKIAYQTEVKNNFKLTMLDYNQQKNDRQNAIIDKYGHMDKNGQPDYPFMDKLIEKRENKYSDIYLSANTEKINHPIGKDSWHEDISSKWLDNAVTFEIIPPIHKNNINAKAFLHQPCFIYTKGDSLFYINNINASENTDTIATVTSNLKEAIFSHGSTGKFFLKLLFLTLVASFLIYLFYSIVMYIVKSVFFINANDLTYFMRDNLFIKETNNNILLLSNDKYLSQKIKKEMSSDGEAVKKKSEPHCVNMSDIINKNYLKIHEISSAENEEQMDRVIIIDNFEYNFADPEINSKKLLFLEEEIYVRKDKVIILSSVNPIGGFILNKIEDNDKLKQETQNKWKNIFSGFVSLSWCYNSVCTDSSMMDIEKEISPDIKSLSLPKMKGKRSFNKFFKSIFSPDIPAEHLIEHELKNNIALRFHPELQPIVLNLLKINKEDISNVKALGKTSFFDIAVEKTRSYHRKLWDSCSTDEKFVLNRLAKDKFLSFPNIKTVETLFRRGLIKREPNLKPFNTFFTHFIKETDFCEDDFLSKKEIQNGWALFRIPIILVFAGIVVFLFATQAEIYKSALTIIPVLTTILIPFALKLLGMFQSKSVISKDTG